MEKVLEFRNVTGKSKKFHLEDVSMEMEAGYIYGLMGENGAGKTTLMNYILDEGVRYEGEILVCGKEIRDHRTKCMNEVGFVSEERVFLGDQTCEQNAKILGMLYDEFDMDVFKGGMKEMGVSTGKVYKAMSRGEKLKFQLAFAMGYHPRLYLLDEVTAGMDPVFRIDFFKMLQRLIMDGDCSVLMTSHISSEIEIKTDYVGILEKGRMVAFGESMDVIPKLRRKVAKDESYVS